MGDQIFVMPDDAHISSQSANADVWELIQALVLGRVPADRILELFYWAQKPGVLELARAILDLRPESSAAITAFFAAVDSKSISIDVEKSGRLTLWSPEITDAAPVLQEIKKAAVSSVQHQSNKQTHNIQSA